MNDGFVQLSVRVPPDMRAWLHKEADKVMSNISTLVRQAIQQIMEQREWERKRESSS